MLQGSEEGQTATVLHPRVELIFDSKDGIDFRRKLSLQYKANYKSCPINLIPKFDFVRDAAADTYSSI